MTNTPAGADNATSQNEQPDRSGDGGGVDSVRAVVGRAVGGGPGTNAVVPLRTGGRVAGIVPTSIEEVFRLATAISKSGMAPRDMGTPEKLTVAILHGLEIGIPPMMAINKIAVNVKRNALVRSDKFTGLNQLAKFIAGRGSEIPVGFHRS